MTEVAIARYEDRMRLFEDGYELLAHVKEEFDKRLRDSLPGLKSDILESAIANNQLVAAYGPSYNLSYGAEGSKNQSSRKQEPPASLASLAGVIGIPENFDNIGDSLKSELARSGKGDSEYVLSTAISLHGTSAGTGKLTVHSVYGLENLDDYLGICVLTRDVEKRFLTYANQISAHIWERIERTEKAKRAGPEITELKVVYPKSKRLQELLDLRKRAEEEKVNVSNERENMRILSLLKVRHI